MFKYSTEFKLKLLKVIIYTDIEVKAIRLDLKLSKALNELENQTDKKLAKNAI